MGMEMDTTVFKSRYLQYKREDNYVNKEIQEILSVIHFILQVLKKYHRSTMERNINSGVCDDQNEEDCMKMWPLSNFSG